MDPSYMIQQCIHTTVNTAHVTLHAADDAAKVVLGPRVRFCVGNLLLDMAFCQKNPTVADPAFALADVGINNIDRFSLFGGVGRFEEFAGEGAGLAGEHLVAVVVAQGLVADVDSLFGVLAHRPGAFAETPVVVFFVGSAV